jgi:large subunit ribosomal protein L15
MTELHNLKPSDGSHRNRKRVGRGPGSGTGKTSGRGQKGQKARSGASIPAGFEGGQMPLQRRIPKVGFTPLNRVAFQVINVRALEELQEAEVTPEVLRAHGLIGSLKEPVKILGTGEISRAVSVKAHAFSASARAKIEAAGGSVSVVGDKA